MRATLGLLALSTLSACAYTEDGWVFQPFQGPGYTLEEGLVLETDADTTYIAAATYLPVARDQVSLFDDRMAPIIDEMEAGPEGLVGYSLGQKMVGKEYRTLTVWEDEEAMVQWAMSEHHLAAIGDAGRIRDPDKTPLIVVWEVSPDALPVDWAEVMERTDSDGESRGY